MRLPEFQIKTCRPGLAWNCSVKGPAEWSEAGAAGDAGLQEGRQDVTGTQDHPVALPRGVSSETWPLTFLPSQPKLCSHSGHMGADAGPLCPYVLPSCERTVQIQHCKDQADSLQDEALSHMMGTLCLFQCTFHHVHSSVFINKGTELKKKKKE